MVSSTPWPHFTPGKDPVPILQEAGWAPGLVWMGGKSRPHRDSIPDRPARSQPLYRLSYPAHINYIVFNINLFGCLCSGDLLIIGAQVVAASQMVLEEKFVSGLDIPALQAVGWEGKYSTTKLQQKIINCIKFLVNVCLCALL